MESSTTAFLLALVLIGGLILLPLVPAILIYKLFPNDNIRAEGFLGKLKINATGAFAGYLIVLVINYSLSMRLPDYDTLVQNISADRNYPWRVNAQVSFEDVEGQEIKGITDDEVKNNLQITLIPDQTVKSSSALKFYTQYQKDDPSILLFSYPGYETRCVRLKELDRKLFFEKKKTIELGKVTLIAEKKYAANPAVIVDTIKY